MKIQTFLILWLLPALLSAQTPVPAPKAPAAKKTYHAQIFLKKKSVSIQSGTLPALRYQETQPLLMDQATYGRLNAFLSLNYSAGRPSLSSGDKLLGLVGTMAGGVCAGVAAVQWMDAQGKNHKKIETSNSEPKTKNIKS